MTVGVGLLVNLEATGVLGIDGPPEVVAGLIRSMVHELATGPARRSVDIRVSQWVPGATLHDHVLCGPVDDLAERLRPWLEDAELGLAAAEGFSAYAMRAAGLGRSLPSLTVVFADVADAADLSPLIDRARRRSLPLAIVLSGDIDQLEAPPEAVVRLGDGTMRLDPYGFTAAMQHLDVEPLLGVEELVAHARRAPMVPRVDQPDGPGWVGDERGDPADRATDPAQAPTEETPEHEIPTELPAEEHEITDQAEEAESGMLIRVLGPVEVEGGPADLVEAERSLLAFLAIVGPSTPRQLRDAVWPGGGIDDAGFEAVLARLRASLGHQLPDHGDGRIRLRSVVTDLGSARRWIAQAGSMSDERARNLLQLALADVRGQPFSQVDERHWQWVADHRMALATQASSLLMDACFDLCDSAYAANDLHLAKWACEVGSLVDPLHETVLTRRVQLIEALAGVDGGPPGEAAALVDQWEARYRDAAGRPAPRGPRMALRGVEASPPYVG